MEMKLAWEKKNRHRKGAKHYERSKVRNNRYNQQVPGQSWKRWEEWEIVFLLSHPLATERELATALGRTIPSVRFKRKDPFWEKTYANRKDKTRNKRRNRGKRNRVGGSEGLKTTALQRRASLWQDQLKAVRLALRRGKGSA